jgi:hypothetical protein
MRLYGLLMMQQPHCIQKERRPMHESGSLHISVRVENLTPREVMESLRRMMRKTYLILWAIVYAVVLLVALVQKAATVYTILGPAVILILLALAYEYQGRKSFGAMGYGEAVMDYELTPKGYRLTMGENSVEFSWKTARLAETRSDFLLYSDQKNSSVLPKRCLTEEEIKKLRTWAETGKTS